VSKHERLPYPGLRAYARDETDIFFGREGCVNEMIDRLAKDHFLAVLGASGSGKSSLVRTGLLDGLELGFYAAAGPVWVIADCHPGGAPLRNLACALLAAVHGGTPHAFEIDTLEIFLQRGPLSIVEWLQDNPLPPDGNLLILVDQFEELFRYADYEGREQAEAFAALLLESARSKAGIHVVITMRSEYLGACALIPGLAEQINSSLYLARRMTREECRQAIVGPAAVTGFDIEPELVTRMLNDLAGFGSTDSGRDASQLQKLSRQADQLPLMQHALSRLWELARRRGLPSRTVLTLKDYLEIGQLQGALDQHANEVVETLSPAAKPLVRRVFGALVAGTSAADAVRRPVRFSELVAIVGADRALVAEVVEAFRARDCHFLRPPASQPLTDETIVDISHESLIRQWRSLADWFAEEARSHTLWGRLIYSQASYAIGEGDRLSGLDLANALAWWERERPTPGWSESHGGKFAEVERFLRESREAEEAQHTAERERNTRERRKLKMRSGISIGLAVVCLLAAGLAVWSRVSLQAANQDLVAANGKARNALKDEQHAKNDAQSAYNEALSGADRFAVGFAHQLLLTPGMSNDDVNAWLKSGENFLQEFVNNPIDRRRVNLTQANFADEAALVLAERGEPAEALAYTAKAEAMLQPQPGREKLSRDEAMTLLKTYRIASQALDDAGRHAEAETKARQALSFVGKSMFAVDDAMLLQQGETEYQVANAVIFNNEYSEGVAHAKKCLDDLGRMRASGTTDQLYYQLRCHVLVSYAGWYLKPKMPIFADEQEAVKDFRLIPESAWTIPILIAGSTALGNVGSYYLGAKDYGTARDYFMGAANLLQGSSLDIKQRPHMRTVLIGHLDSVGETFEDSGDHQQAVDWYRKAVATAMLDQKWRERPELTQALDSALSDMSDSLSYLAWDTDRNLLKQYAETKQQRVETLRLLSTEGLASWCNSCNLTQESDQVSALIKFDRVRGEDRYADAMKLADAVIAQSMAVLAKPSGQIDGVNARRAWFWTVESLLDNAADMPGARSASEQIRRLSDTRTRELAFLKAFPKSWMVTRKLGKTSYELAKLYAAGGNKEMALASAQEGEACFNKDSIKLLADWYRTGSGPLGANPALAQQHDAKLKSRNWNFTTITVSSTLLWMGDTTLYTYSFSIEDPLFKGDDPVTREIWQLETLEGVKIPDDAKATLRRFLTVATTYNVSFGDLIVYKLGASGAASDLAVSVKNNSLAAKKPEDGVQEFAKQWGKPGGKATVEAAVSQLFNDNDIPNVGSGLLDIATAASRDGKPELTDIIVTTILQNATPTAAQGADLYLMRGEARESMNDATGSEIDLMHALALRPDDPEILNELGYEWVASDRSAPAAVSVLERATRLAPKDPYIRDSLGWAYINIGSVDKGVGLLESAVADKPNEPEIISHLADGYRRLGRRDDAVATLKKASALHADVKVAAFIRHEQILLGPDAQPPPGNQTSN
jgi:tetratricopeptide (TPR) repeat protein